MKTVCEVISNMSDDDVQFLTEIARSEGATSDHRLNSVFSGAAFRCSRFESHDIRMALSHSRRDRKVISAIFRRCNDARFSDFITKGVNS